MDLETVRAKMMAQVDAARHSKMAEVFGWTFEVHELAVYVTLRPRRRPGLQYVIRATFEDFPKQAPSYVFVDRETRKISDAGWPPNVMHKPNPTQITNAICTPGTREFHENLHKNDAQWPWDPERFTVLDTLQRIHQMMERGLGDK